MPAPSTAIINHIALSVTDLDESASFYREVMGLNPIPEPFGEGRHAWFDIGNGTELHLIRSATHRREHPRNHHICFSVNDMDRFIHRLTSRDIPFTDSRGNPETINIRPDGIRQIYFTDPDGYWIEVNDDNGNR